MMRKVELLAALLAVAAVPALADAGDPPSRVARLSYQSGTVSFRPGTVEEWTAASLNYPLTTGDHLWADAGAQVEMHIGSTAIRMGSQTALAILNLDDQMAQLSLTRACSRSTSGTWETRKPTKSTRPMWRWLWCGRAITASMSMAITTSPPSPCGAGKPQVNGGGAAFAVHAGQSARISGVDTVSQEMGSAPPPDQFDGWCQTARPARRPVAIGALRFPRDHRL